MATIEPRLMHLLNEAKTPDMAPIKLPPLGHNSGGSTSGPARESVSLPPIEQSHDNADVPKQIPPFKTLADDLARQGTLPDGDQQQYAKEQAAGRLAGAMKSGLPIHTLLGNDPDANGSSHSLRMILDDSPETPDDTLTKKRHRAPTVKDDFPQLPQPLKKQKSTQQVVPPIINGLQDPPPNALVFPPILMDEDDDEAVSRVLKEFISPEDKDNRASAQSSSNVSNVDKNKRRLTKPRRKWSEEETNHLLLGVSKHGVGKWTTILEDPEFKFNDRSAGDLKDRFRTCCPDELRKSVARKGEEASIDATDLEDPVPETPRGKGTTGPNLENLLIEPEKLVAKASGSKPATKDSDGSKQRRSRAHRKKIEDLEELGITGPFKKSDRRQRRPFSEQDDKEILEGLDVYGPQWTKIQRDPNYHLSSRQPTDLRDRVRNKYPDIYARIEKGNMQMKNPDLHKSSTLEPSVSTSIDVSFDPTKPGFREPQLNRTNSGDELRSWPMNALVRRGDEQTAVMNILGSANAVANAGGNIDQMDISRLLLDDSASLTEGVKGQHRTPLPDPFGQILDPREHSLFGNKGEDLSTDLDENSVLYPSQYRKDMVIPQDRLGGRRTTLPTARPDQWPEKR